MIYPAKKDWWLAGMLLVNGLVLVGVGVALPFLDVGGAGRPNPASPIPLVLAGLLLAGTGGLLLWVLFDSLMRVGRPSADWGLWRTAHTQSWVPAPVEQLVERETFAPLHGKVGFDLDLREPTAQ
jgi:hypothetical protein